METTLKNPLEDFYGKTDILLDRLNWMNEPTHKQYRQGVNDILTSWTALESAEIMDDYYRFKYGHLLSLTISFSMHENIEQSLLPDICPDRLLAREKDQYYTTAIITDKDLDNHPHPFFKEVKTAYPQELDLFEQSRKADILPLDIKSVADFCSSLSILSHRQSRVYIHQNAYDAMVSYARDILKQEPIWLDEEHGEYYNGLDKVAKERDILSNDTMTTGLAKQVIIQAAGLNLRNQ